MINAYRMWIWFKHLQKLKISPVYRDACKALPPIPNNTEYRATLLSRFATALAAGCDMLLSVC